jgi:glycosyltransferase involved in cell wall biosynthesis
MLDEVTPVVIAGNEEANIARTLGALAWAREVIVVDSGSTDATKEIAQRFPNVRFLERALDTLANQWTFAVEQARTPWILTLDADYFVTKDFVRELESLDFQGAGYEAEFVYAIDGKPLRASLYPPRAVLLLRDRCEFYMDGHTQRVQIHGRIERLRTKLIHDDRKPFARFLQRQRRYMRQEAEKLRNADPRSLTIASRIRKLVVVAPFAVLFHTLFVKGLILDGVPGAKYAWERFVAELILSRELLRPSGSSDRP